MVKGQTMVKTTMHEANTAMNDVSSSLVVTSLPANDTVVASNGSSALVASTLGSATTDTRTSTKNTTNVEVVATNANHCETLTNDPISVVQQDPVPPTSTLFPEGGTIIRGRRNRKRPTTNFPMILSSESSKRGKKNNGDKITEPTTNAASLEESSENAGSKSSAPTTMDTTKPTTTTATNDHFLNSMSWLCMECKEAEAALDMDSLLVLCEGKCNRPFHLVCVGLKEAPPSWICTDCRDERHICSICQEYGIDQVDVFLCKSKDCGLFFHESCLSMLNVDIKQVARVAVKDNGATPVAMTAATDDETGQNYGNDVMPETTMPEFRCPAHKCWTCTEEIVIKDENGHNEEEMKGIKTKSKGKKKKARKSTDNVFGVKTGILIVSSQPDLHP
jgi:hypothetical protein